VIAAQNLRQSLILYQSHVAVGGRKAHVATARACDLGNLARGAAVDLKLIDNVVVIDKTTERPDACPGPQREALNVRLTNLPKNLKVVFARF
jgi:hypothetical protein